MPIVSPCSAKTRLATPWLSVAVAARVILCPRVTERGAERLTAGGSVSGAAAMPISALPTPGFPAASRASARTTITLPGAIAWPALNSERQLSTAEQVTLPLSMESPVTATLSVATALTLKLAPGTTSRGAFSLTAGGTVSGMARVYSRESLPPLPSETDTVKV